MIGLALINEKMAPEFARAVSKAETNVQEVYNGTLNARIDVNAWRTHRG